MRALVNYTYVIRWTCLVTVYVNVVHHLPRMDVFQALALLVVNEQCPLVTAGDNFRSRRHRRICELWPSKGDICVGQWDGDDPGWHRGIGSNGHSVGVDRLQGTATKPITNNGCSRLFAIKQTGKNNASVTPSYCFVVAYTTGGFHNGENLCWFQLRLLWFFISHVCTITITIIFIDPK